MNVFGNQNDSTIKARKNAVSSAGTNVGSAQPMTFFLRTEADLEKSMARSEDSTLQASIPSFVEDDESVAASVADTSYGVQSLEDAMSINDSVALSARSEDTSPHGGSVIGRKRRPGNPIHPKIYATGQRIVSNEQSASPSSFNESPSRLHNRRASVASSTHLTPLDLSPQRDPTGTPRSNSIRSLRLSDEEASIASETGSQAIQSSSSEEDFAPRYARLDGQREHQLVMPSISMPSRRPFTAKGRAMSQFKVMVAGDAGLGKTSFIRSVFRICEDIVHVDGITASSTAPSTSSHGLDASTTTQITEIQASTKPYPAWWSDVEGSRSWWRRKSFGGDVLERNLRFVDTPGCDQVRMADHIMKELDSWYTQAARFDSMNDNQLVNLLSGKLDGPIDLVLYLFSAEQQPLTSSQVDFLRNLSSKMCLIPVISKCDTSEETSLQSRKDQLTLALKSAGVDCTNLKSPSSAEPSIYTISSLVTDEDIMDASTLMASDYLPALAPSDLEDLVHTLFEPSMIARLRHESLLKFLAWRRTHLSQLVASHSGLAPLSKSPAVTSTGSILDEPSKILVPQAFSSYYRSLSPSASDTSDAHFRPSIYRLPQHEDEPQSTEPSKDLHIAKWARGLRQSLRGDKDKPSKGRLGGELAIIDPRDPLGILSLSQALGRRGVFALQIVGGCGIVGAVVWWLARSFVEWQEWSWPGQTYLSPMALPAPTKGWLDNFRFL